MLSHLGVVQLFVTPWIVVCQATLSMGFSEQEYWSGLPCHPPGELPNPGVEPVSPPAPAFQGASSLLTHRGSPCSNICAYYKHIKYQGLVLGLIPCTISKWWYFEIFEDHSKTWQYLWFLFVTSHRYYRYHFGLLPMYKSERKGVF